VHEAVAPDTFDDSVSTAARRDTVAAGILNDRVAGETQSGRLHRLLKSLKQRPSSNAAFARLTTTAELI
jgi:hypothetical protein